MKLSLTSFALLVTAALALDLNRRYRPLQAAEARPLAGQAAAALFKAKKAVKKQLGIDPHLLKHGSDHEIRQLVDRVLYSEPDSRQQDRKLALINKHLRQRIIHESKKMTTSRSKAPVSPPERRLTIDPNMSSSSIQEGLSDSDTSNQLETITLQQKAMANYSKVHTMLDDVDEKLEDLRGNVNREVLNMSVGMQRRSMLIGHYNFIGAGLGAPSGGNMSMMDPYFHF